MEFDLAFPVSFSGILFFSEDHSVAAYVFFLFFPSLISLLLALLEKCV
jgi:hypothetical protein